jgi:hypothetical protein
LSDGGREVCLADLKYSALLAVGADHVGYALVFCSVDRQYNLSDVVSDGAEREGILLDDAFDCLRIGCSDTGKLACRCSAVESSDKERPGGRACIAGARTDTGLSTLGNSTTEWYRLGGVRYKPIDRSCASRFAEDGNFLRVSPERGNVALHPIQCQALVQKAGIAGSYRQLRRIRETEDWFSSASRIVELGGERVTICPIVCTNDDNVLIACNAAPVEDVLASGTELEVATIDPEHNRFTRSFCGRIDIEVQAVLAFTRITTSTEYSNYEVAMCCRI